VTRTRACLLLLMILSMLSPTPAAQATPTDVARACVAASTHGQTQRDEGHLLVARDALLYCAREECPAIVNASCGEWLSQLEQRIPSVVVRVFATGQGEVTDARVTLDGVQIALDGHPMRLDPGSHVLSVAAPGWLPVKRSFVVAEREQARLLEVQLPRRTPAAR
jgi:hypothetical protein